MKINTMTTTTVQYDETWIAILKGDREAFRKLVEPYLNELMRAARREIRYHIALGDIKPEDITPEELVGETLIKAWEQRHRRPPQLSIKGWLLGIQHRVLQRFIQHEKQWRRMWAISLDAPVPPEPIYDDDESFWEWYQPDDFTKWEDVIPDRALTPEDMIEFEEEETYALEPVTRQVLILHDEHKLSLPEVAYILNLSVEEAGKRLVSARDEVRAKQSKQEENNE